MTTFDLPKTCGKVEKLFDGIGKTRFFNSVDKCMNWYNTVKPHGALDLKTLVEAYY